MKNVTLCLTHWPRYPERIEYLQKTLESLHEQLVGGDWDQFVGQKFVSCESEGVRIDTRNDVTSLCRKYGFEARWRDGYADIGDNLNDMVMQADCPYLFVNQDDIRLNRPFGLGPDVALLESGTGVDIVRYSWFAPSDDAVTGVLWSDGEEYYVLNPAFRQLKPTVWNYYHDMPYLANRTVYDRVGPFLHNGRNQSFAVTEIDYDNRCRRTGIVVVGRGSRDGFLWRHYGHLGIKSSMTEKWAAHWAKLGYEGRVS